MSAPESLKDVYTDEMKDLWSANDQMTKAVKTMAEKAHDPKLKKMLEDAIGGIGKHTESLKSLIEQADEEVEKEHCKGMEGLVKEALKHTTKEAPENGELLDVVIIAQYQRMSHYGMAGFGTAAAYAQALDMTDEAAQLKSIVADIYKGDKFASKVGEHLASLAPKEDEDDEEEDEVKEVGEEDDAEEDDKDEVMAEETDKPAPKAPKKK